MRWSMPCRSMAMRAQRQFGHSTMLGPLRVSVWLCVFCECLPVCAVHAARAIHRYGKTNDGRRIEMNATNYTIVWFKLSEFIVLSRVNAMQCCLVSSSVYTLAIRSFSLFLFLFAAFTRSPYLSLPLSPSLLLAVSSIHLFHSFTLWLSFIPRMPFLVRPLHLHCIPENNERVCVNAQVTNVRVSLH